MKSHSFLILALLTIGFAFGQTESDTIRVIAEKISEGKGDNVQIAKFKVLATFYEDIYERDTIYVVYHFHTVPENQSLPDTALLSLNKYEGDSSNTHFWAAVDYHAGKNIQPAKVDILYFDQFESFTDKTTLDLTRKKGQRNWYIIMPFGGSVINALLLKKPLKPGHPENWVLQSSDAAWPEPLPALNLSDIKDGKYYIGLSACNLGGTVKIRIKTLR